MDEMVRYIFCSLRCSETTMRAMSKALKKQRSFNRSVSFLGIAIALHIISQEIEIHNMHNELEAMQKEIKELKNTEGD